MNDVPSIELAHLSDPEFYRSVLMYSSEGVWVADLKGRTLFVNERMAVIMGGRPSDLIGRPWTDFQFPEDLAANLVLFQKRVEGRRADGDPGEIRFRRVDGAEVFLSYSAARLSRNGVPYAVVGILTDVTARRRMETARALSDDLLSAVFSVSPDCCAITRESDGAIVRVSRSWLELYGFREEEVVGRRTTDLGIFPGEQTRRQVMDGLARDGYVRDLETQVMTRAGEPKTVLVSAERINSGGQQLLFTSQRDITEERRRARQAQDAFQLFEKAFHASPSPKAVVDEETQRILRVNAAWVRLFGHAEADAVGRTAVELGLYAVPAERNRIFSRIRSGVTSRNEFPVRIKGGAERIVEVFTDRVEIGGRTCLLSILRDVTEDRRREREVADANQLFEKAFTASPDACSVVESGSGRLMRVNGAWTALFGFTSDEALGKSVVQLGIFPAEERARIVAKMPVRNWETRATSKSGKPLFVSVSIDEIFISERPCALIIARDVTRQRSDERALREQADELRRSNKELEQFAYVSSHDLKEPLRKVASYAELLHTELGDRTEGDAPRYLRHIVDGVNRMNRLIEDLLAYSRIGREKPSAERVNLSSVAREVKEDLDPLIREKNATVVIGELPAVHAVRTEMRQLFQNLIGNALKFSRDGIPPEIDVRVATDEAGWKISVTDNGIGIDPRYFHSIFGVFQRLHSRQAYPGNGIGLAICKKIVERHGGTLTVTSSPGQGATFAFTLPSRSDMK